MASGWGGGEGLAWAPGGSLRGPARREPPPSRRRRPAATRRGSPREDPGRGKSGAQLAAPGLLAQETDPSAIRAPLHPLPRVRPYVTVLDPRHGTSPHLALDSRAWKLRAGGEGSRVCEPLHHRVVFVGTSPSNINFGGDLVRIPHWGELTRIARG